jgi:hypothetical protein
MPKRKRARSSPGPASTLVHAAKLNVVERNMGPPRPDSKVVAAKHREISVRYSWSSRQRDSSTTASTAAESKKVNRRSPDSERRARETLASQGKLAATGGRAIFPPLVGAFLRDSEPLSRTRSREVPGARHALLPSWADTGDLKMWFTVYAMKVIGGRHARAFTLNLGPDVARRAKSDADWLRRAVVRHVGARTPLILAFDVTPKTGRLHLHGAFAGTDPDDVNRIECGLKAAGREWAASRGQEHQLLPVVLGEERGPLHRWMNYLAESVAAARGVVSGGPLWSMTNTARRMAKALHAEVSTAVNAAIKEQRHTR